MLQDKQPHGDITVLLLMEILSSKEKLSLREGSSSQETTYLMKQKMHSSPS